MNKYLTKIAYIHPLIDEDFKERLGYKHRTHPDYLPDPEDFTEEYKDETGKTHSKFDHAGYYEEARKRAAQIEEKNSLIDKILSAQESHVATGYPSKEHLQTHYQSLMLPKMSDDQIQESAKSGRSFGRGLGGTLGAVGGGVAGAGVGAGAGVLASKAVANPYLRKIWQPRLVGSLGIAGGVAGAGAGAYYLGKKIGNSMHSSRLQSGKAHNDLMDRVNTNTTSILNEREGLLRQHYKGNNQ